LREAIAAHVALTRGVGCSPGQVVVATCIPAAIELAIDALGLSGSEFWVEDPCCRSTSRALVRSGVKVVPIEVDEAGINVQKGMRSAPHAAGVFTTAACQAPTGAALAKERRHQLAEWAGRAGAWIFEDDFNWNGDGSSKPAAPYATYDPVRTIYFNSFNNVLFPGLRIAYLVSPPKLVDTFNAIRGTEGDVSSANQVVLAEFMASGHFHAHLRRLNECNTERRAALLDCVERELCGYLVPKRTIGGYFICGVENKSEAEVLKRCTTHNLVVTGISTFHLTPGERNEVVLGFSQFQPAMLRHAAIEMRAALRLH
jgi:GntR family transcriptional regulator/MocR family aminotransferase